MASEKITNILEEIKSLTILELAELVKAVEAEFGVSAAAPVGVAFQHISSLLLFSAQDITLIDDLKEKVTINSITVKADSYVHAVEIEGEYIFEDSYFSLLPGESKTISYRKSREHSTEGIALNAYTIDL